MPKHERFKVSMTVPGSKRVPFIKNEWIMATHCEPGFWQPPRYQFQQGVSRNRGTPKSSILIGFSIINHPFGGTPIFGNTQQGTNLPWNQGQFPFPIQYSGFFHDEQPPRSRGNSRDPQGHGNPWSMGIVWEAYGNGGPTIWGFLEKSLTTMYFSYDSLLSYVCQGLNLNSHYFHIIGDGHQPNSRGLYTQYKDSY